MDTKTKKETAGRGEQPRTAADTNGKEVTKIISLKESKVKGKAVSGDNGNGALVPKLKPNLDAAIEFLLKFHPKFATVLTAILPDPKPNEKPTHTETFKRIELETKARAFVEKYNATHNIYFTVNPVKHPLNKKASKVDIYALSHLHIDIDPVKGKPIEEERAGLRKTAIEFDGPPASVVVDSGGGYQMFWILKEPIVIKDIAHAEELELYNKALEKDLGADNTHNVDRVMRVPGSVNWPNKKKRGAGRKEALASVVHADWDLTHELETDFKKQELESSTDSDSSAELTLGNLPDVDVSALKLEAKYKKLIVEGESDQYSGDRSGAVFAVACEMVRTNHDNESIAAVLLCRHFKISEHIYAQKNPETYAKRQIQRARDNAIAPELAKLNEEHFVACEGGKVRVFRESYDRVLKRNVLEKMSFQDFSNFYMDRTIDLGHDHTGKAITAKLGKWWLGVKGRRKYKEILFDPGENCPEDVYNLWRGFNCNAVKGSWDLLKEHMKNNLCSGNNEHYRYLLHWMAYAVQHPDEQGHIAIVMKGEQGTGKSVFARAFGKLFGQHFLHIANSKHLVGNFNAHLRDCAVLFADEAFWAGDKQGEGVLKMLVTEEEIMVEGKGRDAILCRSFIHMLIASNHEWVIPAGKGERRYFAIEVSDARKDDHLYFKAIKEELEAGGYEAMLYELLDMDISLFNIRDFPKTKFLQTQKELSMKSWQLFLQQCLHEASFGVEYDWDDDVPCKFVHDQYLEFCKQYGDKRPAHPNRFGEYNAKVFGPDKRGDKVFRRFQKTMEHWIEYPGRKQGSYEKKATWCYQFANISRCRGRWDSVLGKTDWSPLRAPIENETSEMDYGENFED